MDRKFETETIKTIYDHISEEYSKRLFSNRLLYSLTGDREYIHNVVMDTAEGAELAKRMKPFRKFILFGGGVWGGNILWVYPNLNWICVWDNSPKAEKLESNDRGFGEEKYSLPVEKYVAGKGIDQDTAIIISSRLYHDEINRQLISDGIREDQIIDAGGMIDAMSNRQYFDLPYFPKKEDEVFIDAGSFDGGTCLRFHDYYRGKYKEIIAFEPDENNLANFERKISISACHDIQLMPYGLWDRKTELSFESIGNGSSKVSESGKYSINVDALDHLLSENHQVSFIKMDLEGAEFRALTGAERIIRKYHPKLAISLYHKPEDIWELPELILQLYPKYRFYLRHYSIAASETVLYAIPL